MPIQLIKRNKIDDSKWNKMVEQYAFGLPYAYTWYLDAVCSNWWAFVEDDYKSAYPFQIKKIFGLKYSLQPFLTQQLGYIGSDPTTENEIIKHLEKTVFHIHHHHSFFNTKKGIECTNLELSLNASYEDIYKGFNTNTKRNIKKAYKQPIEINISTNFTNENIRFILDNSKFEFDSDQIAKLKKLLSSASSNKALEIHRATSGTNLVSLVVFIKTEKRIIYLIAASNKKGMDLRANFKIIDNVIKHYNHKELILDFEGSNIDGVSRFYKGFGTFSNNYYLYKKSVFSNPLNKILKQA